MKRNIDSEKFLKIKNADKVLEVLFEILTSVQTTQNLNELYKAIHKSLAKVLNVDNFFIANHNVQEDSISFPYFIDNVDTEFAPEIFNFSKTGSLTGQVIKSGKPHIFFLKDLIEFKKKSNLLNMEAVGSPAKIWLGVPLIVNNRTIGAMAVQSYSTEDMYDNGDLDILDMVSQHIAFALERKEADDAIKEQRKVLEKILELSPVGIALVENRIFKRVNNEFVTIFGYESKADFKDKKTTMIYASEEDYDKAGEIIQSGPASKKRSDFEYSLVKKDKTPFPARIIINHSTPADPLSWEVSSITDLSRTENIRKERIQHEKLQGILEMAGAICHELNQPLHAILGYCDLLMMDSEIDRKELKEILEVIIEQVNRIEKITKKLLGITQYKTLKYAGKNRIFDIWNAGSEND
jgi:PAS domain S-box-containing protein